MGLSAIGAGVGAGLGGCSPSLYREGGAWKNAVESRKITPGRLAEPRNLEDLVTVVQDAERAGTTVRAVGSGHSFSDVTLTAGTIVLPTGLTGMLDVDVDSLKPAHRSDPHLVRVKSGTTLADLNCALWGDGLSMPNLGSYDAQTIVGAASNATHGSGLDYEPVCAAIQAIQMVGTGGEILHIEPRDGITATFSGVVDGQPARFVPDDDAFRAALVSLGSMGLIYAVVLRTVPQYWILQGRRVTSWRRLTQPGGTLDRILTGRSLATIHRGPPDNYEILVNPYPGSDRDHKAVVTQRFRQTVEPPDVPAGEAKHLLLNAGQAILGDGTLLAKKLNQNPKKVPRVIDSALEALSERGYVDRGYRVLNLGPANKYRVYGIEMAFALDQTLTAVETIFAVCAEQYEKHGRRLPSPISLRFVKATSAFLAPQVGRNTLMIEINNFFEMKDHAALLRALQHRLHRELRARPHWGLDLDLLRSADAVEALYPETFPKWRAVYERMNAKGTFDGLVTDRLKISMRNRQP